MQAALEQYHDGITVTIRESGESDQTRAGSLNERLFCRTAHRARQLSILFEDYSKHVLFVAETARIQAILHSERSLRSFT